MEDISRRDLLRKGALLGGSVLWVAPVVQTIGIGQAFTQTALVSPGGVPLSEGRLIPDSPIDPDRTRLPPPNIGTTSRCVTVALYWSQTSSSRRRSPRSRAGFDPGITWFTNNNVGSLAQVNPSGVLDCYTNHTDQDIKTAFSARASSGDTVVCTVRVTATDSFGPVSDEQTYSVVIA